MACRHARAGAQQGSPPDGARRAPTSGGASASRGARLVHRLHLEQLVELLAVEHRAHLAPEHAVEHLGDGQRALAQLKRLPVVGARDDGVVHWTDGFTKPAVPVALAF